MVPGHRVLGEGGSYEQGSPVGLRVEGDGMAAEGGGMADPLRSPRLALALGEWHGSQHHMNCEAVPRRALKKGL